MIYLFFFMLTWVFYLGPSGRVPTRGWRAIVVELPVHLGGRK